MTVQNAFVLVALSAGVASLAAFLWSIPLNNDTVWFLIAVPKWLEGAELYRDVVEINPPLIFYMMVLPVKLAEITGLTGSQAVVAILSSLTAVSFALTWRVLQAVALTAGQRMALTSGAAVALLVIPLLSYGQREHILLILSLPYLVAVCLRPMGEGRSRDLSLLLFALPGFLLKPFFLLAPFGLAVLEAVEQRSWRPLVSPAVVVIVISGAIYVGATMALHPAYLGETVPLGHEVYWAYGIPWPLVVMDPSMAAVICAVLAARMVGGEGAVRRVQTRFLTLVAAYAACYALQGKGFPHQSIPLEAAGALLAGWAVSNIDARPGGRALGWLALFALAAHALLIGPARDNLTPQIQPRLVDGGQDKTVVLLTAHLWQSFPMVYRIGADWPSRYPALWPLPGAWRMAAGETGDQADIETGMRVLAETRAAIIEDLKAGQPDYVLVDVRPYKPYYEQYAFDYLSFLSQDPDFIAFWEGYRYDATVQGLEIWVKGR